MFPAVTAVATARNVARRSVLVKFCLVSLRFLTISQGIRDRDGALWSVTDACTFPPDLSRSVGTYHVLSRSDPVLLRLSSYVKFDLT